MTEQAVATKSDGVARFELAQREATAYSKSSLVPKEFRENVPNCLIALNMAHRMGADPLMVMQNLYLVQGRPSWSAQFLISMFNATGRFSPIRYQFFGKQGAPEWGCRAVSRDLASGEEIEGCLVTIAMANAEGWATKAGSKWKTMPEQMLRYRAASWLVRAFAPELTMGLSTVEESEDVGEIDQRPAPRRASTILTSITGPAPALAPENAESAPAPAAEPEPPAYQQIGDEPE